MNECMPKYEPGQDLTGHVAEVGGVVGCRLLDIVDNKQGVEAVSDNTSGGNIVVGYPEAGGTCVGVAGYDCAEDGKVKLVRGAGKVVPILTGDAIDAGEEVEATATGRVVPLGTTANGRAIGRCWRDAANATFALIELYIGGAVAGGEVNVEQGAITHLTDNTAGAANDVLQAIPDPADAPATADALRDDLVANALPALRNDLADLAAKQNAVITALEGAGILA